MTVTADTLRQITIKASTQGVKEATAAVERLAAAYDKAASARARLAAAEAYARQTDRLDEQARMQAGFVKAMKVADHALEQGDILSSDHASRVGRIKRKSGQSR